MTKAQCRSCTLSYELVPPADTEYSYAKEKKPTTDDYLERVYECEEGHRNTIWWVKREYASPHFFMSMSPDS